MLGFGRILFPRLPCLVLKDPVAQTSRVLVEPHLIDAEFRKAWMPFLCRSGHPVVKVDQFLSFVDPFLHQEAELDLPRITRQDHLDAARAQKSLLQVGWMVGLGMRLRLNLSIGSPVWLFCWSWLGPLVFGLRVYWMLILP